MICIVDTCNMQHVRAFSLLVSDNTMRVIKWSTAWINDRRCDVLMQQGRMWEPQGGGRRPSMVSPSTNNTNGNSSSSGVDIPSFLKKRGQTRYPR